VKVDYWSSGVWEHPFGVWIRLGIEYGVDKVR